jgi:hypothetical protein
LAEIFNDVEEVRFQNPSISYHTPLGSTYAIPVVPWKAVDVDHAMVARQVCEINPNVNVNIREGAWFKTKYGELKSQLLVIFHDFYSSGQQNCLTHETPTFFALLETYSQFPYRHHFE